MEVRWVISEGEETNPTETIVWWGCTLRPAPRDAAPAPGVWELHYDANVHLGFAAGDSTCSTHRRGHVGGPRRRHHPPLATGGIRGGCRRLLRPRRERRGGSRRRSRRGTHRGRRRERLRARDDARAEGSGRAEERRAVARRNTAWRRSRRCRWIDSRRWPPRVAGLKDGLMHAFGRSCRRETDRTTPSRRRTSRRSWSACGDRRNEVRRGAGRSRQRTKTKQPREAMDVFAMYGPDFSLTQHVKYSPTEYA